MTVWNTSVGNVEGETSTVAAMVMAPSALVMVIPDRRERGSVPDTSRSVTDQELSSGGSRTVVFINLPDSKLNVASRLDSDSLGVACPKNEIVSNSTDTDVEYAAGAIIAEGDASRPVGRLEESQNVARSTVDGKTGSDPRFRSPPCHPR